MKKLLIICIALAGWSVAHSQGSTADEKYRAYRHETTEPPYALAKVKSLIAKIKRDNEDNRYLPEQTYAQLSTREKFTYVLLHGEDFAQNCAVMPQVANERSKIFAHIPEPFDEESLWSRRQRAFLNQNRASVIGMLRDTMSLRHRAGVNIKAAILEINGVELVPDLIKAYNYDKKDNDVLTLLMQLMESSKYKPFLNSEVHKKLYGNNYQSFVMATPSLKNRIIALAERFSRRK